LGLLLPLKVALGDLCLSTSCKVDSSHAGHFMVLGTIIGSTGSSLGCSGEHVVSSLGPSCYSS
jgi:hypothetical protein